MPDSKETAPKLPDDTSSVPISIPPVPILTYQLPRNPCIFSGDDQQDANKWLMDFQLIVTYNHWDDQMCLANVIFYLAGQPDSGSTTMRTLSPILLRSKIP
ncbi:hypothetical protein AVEN_142028-1 [Araneus ventricosus]|uniref:Uncharacterized protein n=1 Tax=Araneus ventricosus TaxID=182803 RepID=A0A4Y2US26_ARAVE|nr:hypothetical protein AVEN_142028-1 [Araneus ventricosus]